MRKLLINKYIYSFLCVCVLGGCQQGQNSITDNETHVMNFSLKGVDAALNSSLSDFTAFHLYITSSIGEALDYKSFDNLESIPAIAIKPGTYQLLMLANAKSESFKIPEIPLTETSVITLQPTATTIPELCISNKSITIAKEEDNVLELMLERVVGKINMEINNVPKQTTAIQVKINNMFNSVQADGSYPSSVATCTFNLIKDAETGSYTAKDVLLFPTNGRVNLTYTIEQDGKQSSIYTQTLNESLNANSVLNITTTLSDISYSITPQISLKAWNTPISIDNSITIGGKEEIAKGKVLFSGLPKDFNVAKLSVTCKNERNELLPVEEVEVSSETAIEIPAEASKLLKATFTNDENNSFSVYFGETGTEGIYCRNFITLPTPPTIGTYHAGGIIISRKGDSGYKAYQAKAISTDIWEKTRWGTSVKTESKLKNDAKANDNALTAFLDKYEAYTINNFEAFKVCREYRAGGYNDWYFASQEDIVTAYKLCKKDQETFNRTIQQYKTTNTPITFRASIIYISSTEVDDTKNKGIKILEDESYYVLEEYSKGTPYNVCAVRHL